MRVLSPNLAARRFLASRTSGSSIFNKELDLLKEEEEGF
jgi:hypothetical protein